MKISEVCAHCGRVVDFGEGLVDDMRWYHMRCYHSKLKSRIDILTKKAKNGSITLSEYDELQETVTILGNLKKEISKPEVHLKDILHSQHPIFEGKSAGMRILEEHNRALKTMTLTAATEKKQLV